MVDSVLGSKLEDRIYQVLLSLGYSPMDITTQYEIYGGAYTPGGIIIDFLLWIGGRAIPIQANGEYWHRGIARDDTIMNWKIHNVFGIDPVILWGDKCETVEATKAEILRLIGRA